MTTFMGYRRADGRVGVRNHVAVVSTVFCCASVAQRIAQATGAVAITHEGGCLELGPDREHTEQVLRGAVAHPNVGAVLVVGLSCEQVQAEEIARAAVGKPAHSLLVRDEGGTERAIERGIERVRELMEQVADAPREPIGVDELILATQCGSSDTSSGLASNPAVGVLADKLLAAGGAVFLGETGSLYGAAGLMARRAVTPEVGQRILDITDAVERFYARMGKSLREANPTPGNIAGGLTTLVEKSLGGVRKGGTAPIQGVLGPAEQLPVGKKGLWIMDTSLGLGMHIATDLVVGGAQVLVYTTGRGNPVGSALAPTIKITATPETIGALGCNMDFDASPVLVDGESLEACGQRLWEKLLRVASGELTKAEQLGHTMFAVGRVPV